MAVFWNRWQILGTNIFRQAGGGTSRPMFKGKGVDCASTFYMFQQSCRGTQFTLRLWKNLRFSCKWAAASLHSSGNWTLIHYTKRNVNHQFSIKTFVVETGNAVIGIFHLYMGWRNQLSELSESYISCPGQVTFFNWLVRGQVKNSNF